MLLKQFVVGQLEVNCWLVTDEATRETMIIDPGDEPDRIEEWIRREKLKVKFIVCTHSHFDHVGALPELKASTGAAIVLHKDEKPLYDRAHELAVSWGFKIGRLPKPEVLANDGGTIAIGGATFRVIHTPGHSPGGICLLGNGSLFSGDTLFAGSIGRTDLPGGDFKALSASLAKLKKLPDNTIVHPGHGPSSNIGKEKMFNPYMNTGQ
ncbi:MAG: MBL fold metallo-hydrolase [Nitrospirae bacterium]|nr:MBL fold metallo-hydrolase [Nitrospirota bacterium]